MRSWRTWAVVAGIVAALPIAGACRDALAPERGSPDGLRLDKKKDKPNWANFRLTGGGRVDQRDHLGYEKSTPDSRDFATFGFQARPLGPNTSAGSGQFTWVEHNPAELGGGFSFHGQVSAFLAADEDPADCGHFGGSGTLRLRDGRTFDGVVFEVFHACDKGEPGVGRDHIHVRIADYYRHGILSGGNIQKHKL